MVERWETAEDIAAARRRFEAAIPGWTAPAAYGVGRVDPPGRLVEFAHVNVGGPALPALVLATACGHTMGSASYVLSAGQLDQAITLLEPAEAHTANDHPNLRAWRRLRADLGDSPAVAVFLGDDADHDNPLVEQLRQLAEAA